jgi:peptidoglycan/LPS O-acetylase OafA/YrhL
MSSSNSNRDQRRPAVVAAGLLLVALALVVIYTNRGAFFSPLALVVVAAIGLAALLLQLRLRPEVAASTPVTAARGPLWLNGAGVLFAVGAVLADYLHRNPAVMVVFALAAVVSFGVSGIIVLSALRKRSVDQ